MPQLQTAMSLRIASCGTTCSEIEAALCKGIRHSLAIFHCRRVRVAGSFLLGQAHFWPSFILLVIAGGAMYAPYGPFFAWIAERLPRNVAGGAIALINGFGALGSFVGSYAIGWLDSVTGTPQVSYLLMAGALLISGVITLSVGAGQSHTAVAGEVVAHP
jgi:MFS family permease